jgi:hypothetical protein
MYAREIVIYSSFCVVKFMLPDIEQILPKLSAPRAMLIGPATSIRHSTVGVVPTLLSGRPRNRCSICDTGNFISFSKCSHRLWSPPQTPIERMLRGSVPANKATGGLQLTIHLHLVPIFQTALSLPSFPRNVLVAFCLTEHNWTSYSIIRFKWRFVKPLRVVKKSKV